ncbi:protein of unknown function (plasmid) [Pararobbsia alpina]
MPSAVRPVRTRSWRASRASWTSSNCCCHRFRKRTAREALTHMRSAKGLCGTFKRAPDSLSGAPVSGGRSVLCGIVSRIALLRTMMKRSELEHWHVTEVRHIIYFYLSRKLRGVRIG